MEYTTKTERNFILSRLWYRTILFAIGFGGAMFAIPFVIYFLRYYYSNTDIANMTPKIYLISGLFCMLINSFSVLGKKLITNIEIKNGLVSIRIVRLFFLFFYTNEYAIDKVSYLEFQKEIPLFKISDRRLKNNAVDMRYEMIDFYHDNKIIATIDTSYKFWKDKDEEIDKLLANFKSKTAT